MTNKTYLFLNDIFLITGGNDSFSDAVLYRFLQSNYKR